MMSIDLVLLIINLSYVVLFAVVIEGLVEWLGASAYQAARGSTPGDRAVRRLWRRSHAIRANAELNARLISQEARIETLTQRLTAALLERDQLSREMEVMKRHLQALDRRKIDPGDA